MRLLPHKKNHIHHPEANFFSIQEKTESGDKAYLFQENNYSIFTNKLEIILDG